MKTELIKTQKGKSHNTPFIPWSKLQFLEGYHLLLGIVFLAQVFLAFYGSSNGTILSILLSTSGILVLLFFCLPGLRKTTKGIKNIEQALGQISHGEFSERVVEASEDLGQSVAYLFRIQQNLQTAAQFSYSIGQGNFQVDLTSAGENDLLSNSLLSMRDQLKQVAEEEGKRNWVTNGIAQLSDILRGNEGVKETYDRIVHFLIKYTESNQGGLFVLQGEGSDKHLELVAMYAYERKKYLTKRIEIGEGLVGRSVLEKDSIFLTDVPQEYVQITSGLGNANPRCVFIMPLIINEEVQGVLEMASFKVYPPHYLDFVKRSAENIASVIANTRISERTSYLLKQSQEQTEMLRAQEEEVRQNLEEMSATQEELARKNQAIEEASVESKCIMQAIDSTMATIEFTPQGIVLSANAIFLRTMRYSLEEIIGKHHRLFVTDETAGSLEYESFWARLGKGEAITAVFKRKDKRGATVWLNAIYNPILNAAGEVVKVVKFATDVTAEQEMLAENKGVLSGIDATMAIIEFTPQGKVLTANANFLSTMKYSQEEIRDKPHSVFVPDDILQTEEYKQFWTKLSLGEAHTGVFKRVDSKGEIVWLNAIYNPIKNASGQVIKVVKFATDISAQKQKEEEVQMMLEETKAQEEELRQNMEELSATQEDMNKVMLEMQAQNNIINSVAIVSKTDLQGNITYVNREFLKWSKYSKEEVMGQNHRFLKSGDQEDALFIDLWKTISSGKMWRGEIKNKAKDGSIYWVDAIIAPVLDADGKPKEYLAQRFVVNEKKALEAALKEKV